MNHPRVRRSLGFTLLALSVLALPACGPGGHFTVMGYTTQPNYNPEIRTVRVPIFQNETYWRGLEFDLTEALIREIEAKTPFKVVPAWREADTELVGVIANATKTTVNVNQLGGVRDAETTLTLQITWRDLRAGVIGDDVISPLPDPNGALPPPEPQKVLVQSTASFRTEIGESITTSKQRMVANMARQVVSMMEAPW